MPRYTIRPFVVSLLLATTALAATSCTVQQKASQPPPDVEQLKAAAMKGSLKDAEALSKLRDNPAILAMRDVLAKSDNVQVKIAMIQGLGHVNKDIDSVELFLDIMEKSDDQVELRTRANEAAESCGVPGRFYKGDEEQFIRQFTVKYMKEDFQKLLELKAVPKAYGRQIPNAKFKVREKTYIDQSYVLCIPFDENAVRMRVSPSLPNTPMSYYLELEASSHHWDWKDLVMRVDVQHDGSMMVTAVSAITSPWSFDLYGADGKLLLYDFGPNLNNTYTFPSK